jgi:hypothetical protein
VFQRFDFVSRQLSSSGQNLAEGFVWIAAPGAEGFDQIIRADQFLFQGHQSQQ